MKHHFCHEAVRRLVVERCDKSIATTWEKLLDLGESPSGSGSSSRSSSSSQSWPAASTTTGAEYAH